MSMYYADCFSEDELKESLRDVFKYGLAAYSFARPNTKLEKARRDCLGEVFEHMVDWGLPNLEELRSSGALHEYAKLKKETER